MSHAQVVDRADVLKLCLDMRRNKIWQFHGGRVQYGPENNRKDYFQSLDLWANGWAKLNSGSVLEEFVCKKQGFPRNLQKRNRNGDSVADGAGGLSIDDPLLEVSEDLDLEREVTSDAEDDTMGLLDE